jgi:predicted house-cleaning NTP pyrophosphatase (Maf/HAM1 superfamily)
LVIGSDQVASFNRNILGKPKSYEEAFKTIMAFSNGEVIFYTGVAIIHKNKGIEESYIDITRVIFKIFNDVMLKEYLDSEVNLNTTAGVKIESKLFQKLVDEIETKDPEAIIGLPIQWLLKKLIS